jgi:hypothetical protein
LAMNVKIIVIHVINVLGVPAQLLSCMCVCPIVIALTMISYESGRVNYSISTGFGLRVGIRLPFRHHFNQGGFFISNSYVIKIKHPFIRCRGRVVVPC